MANSTQVRKLQWTRHASVSNCNVGGKWDGYASTVVSYSDDESECKDGSLRGSQGDLFGSSVSFS